MHGTSEMNGYCKVCETVKPNDDGSHQCMICRRKFIPMTPTTTEEATRIIMNAVLEAGKTEIIDQKDVIEGIDEPG